MRVAQGKVATPATGKAINNPRFLPAMRLTPKVTSRHARKTAERPGYLMAYRRQVATGAWDTTRNRWTVTVTGAGSAAIRNGPRTGRARTQGGTVSGFSCMAAYSRLWHDRQFTPVGAGHVLLTNQSARLADSQVVGTGSAIVQYDVWIRKLELDLQSDHGADVCRADGGVSGIPCQVVQPEAGEEG